MIPRSYRAAEFIDRGREFTGGDLATVSGLSRHHVGELIRKLAAQGKIVCTGRIGDRRIWKRAEE